MNKKDLASVIMSNTKRPKISSKQARAIVDLMFDTITEALMNGEDVTIDGFGSFKTTKRAGHLARNIHTGEVIPIEPHTIPTFKYSQKIKLALRK